MPDELPAPDSSEPSTTPFIEALVLLQQRVSASVTALGPALIGLIVGEFTTIGRSAHPAIFDALAATIPLLFIGAVVEFGLVAQRVIAQPALPAVRRSFVRSVGRTYVAWFATGEGAALYAIGTGARSTLLLVASIAALFSFALDIATSNPMKLAIDPFSYESWAKRFQLRLSKAATEKRQAGLTKDAEVLERLSGAESPPPVPDVDSTTDAPPSTIHVD